MRSMLKMEGQQKRKECRWGAEEKKRGRENFRKGEGRWTDGKDRREVRERDGWCRGWRSDRVIVGKERDSFSDVREERREGERKI